MDGGVIYTLDDEILVRNSGKVTLKKVPGGHDGNLIIMESLRDVPFEIKRIYYINHLDSGGKIRGKHAHRQLQQVIFCISGSFILGLDDGERRMKIRVDRDNLGIVLGPALWHTMEEFSDGCVLLVVASDYYDEKDYMRSYTEFLEFVGSAN